MAGTATHRAAPATPIHAAAPRNRAAHRAAPAQDDPANVPLISLLNSEPIPVTGSGRSRHRGKPAPVGGKRVGTFTIGAVTGTIMMIQLGFATTGPTPQIASAAADTGPQTITADTAAVLTRERPTVATTPAPPPVVVAPPVSAIIPLPPPRLVVPPPAPAPVALAPAAAAPPPALSSRGGRIADAARGQVGVWQDCVAAASKALAAAGISWYDWPIGAFNLGTQVGYAQAIPGDVIYYRDGGAGVAHVAIYIGNGQAVHGGFNGNQTVIGSAFVGSGPIFIRV